MIPTVSKMFDDLIAAFRSLARPQAIMALVIDSEGTVHFTVQGDPDIVDEMPGLLIQIADTVRDGTRRQKTVVKH